MSTGDVLSGASLAVIAALWPKKRGFRVGRARGQRWAEASARAVRRQETGRIERLSWKMGIEVGRGRVEGARRR